MNLANVLLLLAACLYYGAAAQGSGYKEAIELSMSNHDHVLGSAQVQSDSDSYADFLIIGRVRRFLCRLVPVFPSSEADFRGIRQNFPSRESASFRHLGHCWQSATGIFSISVSPIYWFCSPMSVINTLSTSTRRWKFLWTESLSPRNIDQPDLWMH